MNQNRLSLQPEIDALVPGASPEQLGGYDPDTGVTPQGLKDFRKGLASVNHPDETPQQTTAEYDVGTLVAKLRQEQNSGESHE